MSSVVLSVMPVYDDKLRRCHSQDSMWPNSSNASVVAIRSRKGASIDWGDGGGFQTNMLDPRVSVVIRSSVRMVVWKKYIV
jgi:hypothetical protein